MGTITEEERILKKELAERYAVLRNKHIHFDSLQARKAYQEKTWELDKKLQAMAGKRFNAGRR
jgi:hypothetical protein